MLATAQQVNSTQTKTATQPVNPQRTPQHLKYLGRRILLHSNDVCTFQLELIISGDISPNPGPDPNVNSNISTPDSSTQKKQSVISYDRDILLSLNTKCNIPRLSYQVWDKISTLGINSWKKRGKRGGRRKNWLTNWDNIQHIPALSNVVNSTSSTPIASVIPTLTSATRFKPKLRKCNADNLKLVRRRTNNSLNVDLWNARSVRNKSELISDYIMANIIDLMIITETWLASEDPVVIKECTPPGYTFLSIPRGNDDCHGGIVAIFKSSLKLSNVNIDFKPTNFEFACFTNPSKSIHINCYLLPPLIITRLKE